MARLMAKAFRNSKASLPDCITYVPLVPLKYKERGFNQSHLLAKWVGRRLKVPVRPLLFRSSQNVPQASLGLSGRALNVAGCFQARKSHFRDARKVVIVDDVMTSGSTLNECAKALSEAGMEAITVLTLMSVPEGG